MLIVITNPTPIANEAEIINGLFDEGLEILHIRKPSVPTDELRKLIDNIKVKNHQQIALHQHHELAAVYGIKRLHFTETKRLEMTEEAFIKLKDNLSILSTSIHHIEAYKTLSTAFKYCFFGPVFNSISKQGYISILPNDYVLPIQLNQKKVVAIGGINAANISMVKGMQFNGAAVLGAIWQKPNDSIIQFKAIQKAWN